jgi:membrane associated rhomboid family serine protease
MFQSSLVETVAAVPFRPLVVVLAVVGVTIGIRRLLGRRLATPLRRRLLLGVPWGTLLTAAGVVAIYLFVQGAYWYGRPLVTPFRTWSYFYPTGLLLGAFTHGGIGHLVGNVMGTLVYGTVVEYAWSHYPQRRGQSSFSSWSTNPFVRILAVPVAMVVVGLFTGIFALGPIVGFSGVVFALAGVALVLRPYLFLGALLASRVVNLVLSALQSPEPTVGGGVQFVTPWWADIAIQGHAIGLLAGVFLGATLLWARSERPTAGRVFFATLVFAVSQGLWAIYAPVGGGRFTLFRWLGTALVFLLALLVAAGTTLTDDRLLPSFEGGWPSVAAFALIIGLGALCVASVPANLVTIGAADVPEDGVEVRDYVVTYEEDIPNAYAANIPVPLGGGQNYTESGVVVASPDREIWVTQVPSGRLALNGRASVAVGGVGWRETVRVNRTGWAVSGNDTVYSVAVSHDETSETTFRSDPSTADGTVAGRNVTLRPAGDDFEIAVRRGNTTVASGPVPANMSEATIGGLTFERNRSQLYVGANDTRVPIARASGR